MNKSQVKIYIDSSRPYYYPGEQFLGSVLLDVLETVSCSKMLIIAKGKQIVKASQPKIDKIIEDEEDDERVTEGGNFNETVKTVSDDTISKGKNDIVEIDKTKKIFKYKKIIDVSKNNYLTQGKYSFPFEVELPNNIPGSFLFLDFNTYVEIIYTIKVKLNNVNIKQSIPIVIRQKEEIFHYPDNNEYIKNIQGCCCEMAQSKIKICEIEKYTLDKTELKVHVHVDNSKCGYSGSPINSEVYQEIILNPKDINNRIKVTRIVGNYKGKNSIEPRKEFNKKISIPINLGSYISEHLSETKSIKYFKHKEIIPLISQSIQSDSIINKFEIYVESQLTNLSGEEIGVFSTALIYPPEAGILSKTVKNKSKEFTESLINKKTFINSDSMDDDSDFKMENYKIQNSDNNNDLLKTENNLTKNTEISINNNKSNDIKENMISEKNNNMVNEEISFGSSSKNKFTNSAFDTNSNNIKKNFNQNYLDDALDDEFIDN
jgi:hypothetical protein